MNNSTSLYARPKAFCTIDALSFIRAIESSDILAKKSWDLLGPVAFFRILCTKSTADLWKPPNVVMTTGWMSQFLPSAIFKYFAVLSLAASSEY